MILTPRPTPGSFGQNLTCDIHGDPHVDCFNGDQFSANPTANNNMTIMYQMNDHFLVVGELNQTLTADNQWVTYVETAYVKFNGNWVARVSSRDCRPETPVVGVRSAAVRPRTTALQYIWGASEEGIILTFTCPGEGLDVFFNKMDYSQEAIAMGALEWEKAQPGYTGDCLKCNYVAYNGDDVPRFDTVINTPLNGQTTTRGAETQAGAFESGDQAGSDNSSGVGALSPTLLLAMVAAATLALRND